MDCKSQKKLLSYLKWTESFLLFCKTFHLFLVFFEFRESGVKWFVPPPSKATFREWMQSRLWGIGFPHHIPIPPLLQHLPSFSSFLLSLTLETLLVSLPWICMTAQPLDVAKKYLNMHENVLRGNAVFFAKWQSMYGCSEKSERRKREGRKEEKMKEERKKEGRKIKGRK